MAFRSTRMWKSLATRLSGGRTATFVTSTAPRMKAYAAGAANDLGHHKPKHSRAGDYVPVYVALGLILMSVTLGLHTAKQQMMYSPTVRVKKSRRETLPEVLEPETVAEESEKFLTRSFFRKVAHVQDLDKDIDFVVPNPVGFTDRPKVESLRSVGVDPAKP